MLRRVVSFVKDGPGRSPYLPLPLYESVRHLDSMTTHKHLTFSKVPNQRRVRKPRVELKKLKIGEPVSGSVNLGDMSKAREFKFDIEALNSRGFLRFQKPYSPPPNADLKVIEICKSCLNIGANDANIMNESLGDSRQKYALLTKASEEFQHSIPNSMLHRMNTVGDIVEFYCTPVDTQTPYERLARLPDLPPNLHVQEQPIRFHPDTDQLFGGQTAFTKSSTIVTGLRSKKKYRGYETKMTWP